MNQEFEMLDWENNGSGIPFLDLTLFKDFATFLYTWCFL